MKKKISETRDQWGKFVAIVGVCAVGSWAAGTYEVLGNMTNALIAGMFITPLGMWGNKIRRMLADVRYRVGKLQKTGDGGEDCWSVIVDKEWISFWRYPLDHFKKPFLGTEVTVDCAGYAPGSVRCGKRPITVLGDHEKFVVPIGSADRAEQPAKIEWDRVAALGVRAGFDIAKCVRQGVRYGDLSMVGRQEISECDFYTLMGLYILRRDGLQF